MQPSYLLLVALLNVIIPPVVTVGTTEQDNTEQEQHLGEWPQHSSRHRTLWAGHQCCLRFTPASALSEQAADCMCAHMLF